MGLALLDTSVVIAPLGHDDALHQAASRALRAERDRHALAISALTHAELLVGPLRTGRGLKLPDAVIVATGLRLQADVIVTADAR
jgi:predicted nucleic acid-binding protein